MTFRPLILAACLLLVSGCASHKPTTRPAQHDPREALAQVQRRILANSARADTALNDIENYHPGLPQVATLREINADNRDIAGEVQVAAVSVSGLVDDNAKANARADKAEARAKDSKDWYWAIRAGMAMLALGIAGVVLGTYWPVAALARPIGFALAAGGGALLLSAMLVTAATPILPYAVGAVVAMVLAFLLTQLLRWRHMQKLADEQRERDIKEMGRANRDLYLTVDALKPLIPPAHREQAKRIAAAVQTQATQAMVEKMQADPNVPDLSTLTETVPADAVTATDTVTVNADVATVQAGTVAGAQ